MCSFFLSCSAMPFWQKQTGIPETWLAPSRHVFVLFYVFILRLFYFHDIIWYDCTLTVSPESGYLWIPLGTSSAILPALNINQNCAKTDDEIFEQNLWICSTKSDHNLQTEKYLCYILGSLLEYLRVWYWTVRHIVYSCAWPHDYLHLNI